MDIVFTINGIHILGDVVIYDLTHANFVLWVDSSGGMVMMIIA
jgi:hypothetical protein